MEEQSITSTDRRPVVEVLVATTNEGKLREIRDLFSSGPVHIKLYSLKDFPVSGTCAETGRSFMENAASKALFYSRQVEDVYTIGDDSGLEVGVLNGAPGVHSARYSDPGATDQRNIEKLLAELRDIPEPKAKFVTAVCLCKNGQIIATFTGEVEGVIIGEKRGSHGFGYDPVFYYPPLEKTFGQLSVEEKNRVSHRAKAIEKVREFLATHPFDFLDLS